jgi:hypothetical protein
MDLGKRGIWRLLCVLSWTILLFFPFSSKVHADLSSAPEPHPPTIRQTAPDRSIPAVLLADDPPSQEWTYHKTNDDQHPDGNEQQMVWLMNHARANPSQEGVWLANTGNEQVDGAIDYWNVDLALMQDEFDGYPSKPPAAFDVRLYNAAKAHCDNLIDRDAQDHNGQFTLIGQSGFNFEYARGIVYSYAENALYGHAGFNIDWGPDGGDNSGMQPDRGHRLAIMSIDNPLSTNVVEDSDTNVGIAVVVVPSSDPAKSVGPLVIAGDFCEARTSAADHFNRFLVGTVWQDANHNALYDPGEGMAGITVFPDHGTYYAVTADSGGYAIPITAAGSYRVTFNGPGIDGAVTRPANIAGVSVLLDLLYTSVAQATTGNASDITTNAADLNGTVATHGRTTNFFFQYGTTDAYGSATATESVSADSAVTAAVSGLAESTVYHFRLVASNAQGTSYGDDRTFQTKASIPLPPQAATEDASDITTDTADLNGTVITHGETTEYFFQYGTTDAYGSATATESVAVDGAITVTVSGLAENTVYHFRLVASNAQGTSNGDDLTFQTSIVNPSSDPGNAPASGGSGGGGGCFISTARSLKN